MLRVIGKYSRCVALYSSSLKQCAYYGVNCDYHTNVVNLNLAEIIVFGQSGLLSA